MRRLGGFAALLVLVGACAPAEGVRVERTAKPAPTRSGPVYVVAYMATPSSARQASP
ncbi:hypothetical protein [Sinosporangium siamense]|uniref:Lipoprotein n=1 Tax=Sinosporangium siamense TaxID=1367973 RepID=A0A919RK29_9ACTN|nr:hypothetical protein [Sinosporangium siamense]GII93476.1 hypothetical protein Ssi02_37070 [Sinosporangium siamense]